jgi:glycyl-tRNA synthetase beta chain
MEEIPARFTRGAASQLREKVTEWLTASRIPFKAAEMYATPRRIAVLAREVAENQQDLQEEIKGPAKSIALDERGEWTKAALGFARSQGVEPEDLFFREVKGTEYVFARKNSSGGKTAVILEEQLADLIASMSFPKNMRWGSYSLKFVRPIRWLVVLFGEDVIPLELAGVQSGRTTYGHRFLGEKADIPSAGAYADTLRTQYVYADMEERKSRILQQIDHLAKDKRWNIAVNDDLLEEVLFLVEYPTVLYGSFDPEFLQIPQEVLITSMREHQRYFPVKDGSGRLLPYFVTVRNGDDRHLDIVAKGNEKVLRARLADAKFFYEEDQKLPIDTALARLETIVFHEDLGTVGDKVRRIRSIAEKIGQLLQAEASVQNDVARAAAICKFDLVTQMVYEFPELQGIMGEDYARKAGEKEAVARALFEHYQPRFSGDSSPASLVGAIVSMADKIDTIVGCFSVGIIPTGSQDPYALRRQAAGIVQILLDHGLNCALTELFDTALAVHKQANTLKRDESDVRNDLYDFFALRIKHVLSEKVRYDVADAVMASGFDDVPSTVRRAEVLMDQLANEEMKPVFESFNRVINLAGKAEGQPVRPELFTEQVERELYETWSGLHAQYHNLLGQRREAEALQLLGKLKEPINRYFDTVMVMVDDPDVRGNRLATLQCISQDLQSFAVFPKIVW